MSIVSIEFILFLAVALLLYFIVPKKLQCGTLLVINLAFYAFFGLPAMLCLAICVLSVYFGALGIQKAAGAKQKKLLLVGVLVLNIGYLLYVKYAGLTANLLNTALHREDIAFRVIVPLGIAFYTLQAASYLMDVYRGKYEAERNIVRFAAYMSFFPIIMQGPISRYDRLSPTLCRENRFDFNRFISGAELAIWGYFKKTVIADRAALVVNTVFDNSAQYGGLVTLVAMILYAVQLYTDFSGCVDICRGVSEVMGIELEDNFKHPYFADSVKEFWHRWHISLSTWLRDYLYFPLGGSRKGTARKYVNTMIVFLVSGLWHGVGLQYLVWGFLHGAYQVVGDLLKKPRQALRSRLGINEQLFSHRLFQKVITFILITAAWTFFRADSVTTALNMFRSLLDFNPFALKNGALLKLGITSADWTILLFSIFVLWVVSFLQERMSIRKTIADENRWFRYLLFAIGILSIFLFGIYGPGYSASQFIYMQF